jgi:hypothetical protein
LCRSGGLALEKKPGIGAFSNTKQSRSILTCKMTAGEELPPSPAAKKPS